MSKAQDYYGLLTAMTSWQDLAGNFLFQARLSSPVVNINQINPEAHPHIYFSNFP